MAEQSALAALEAELETLNQQGRESVDIQHLKMLIANLRKMLPSDTMEVARRSALAELEIEAHRGREGEWQSTRQFLHDSSMELFRSVITAGTIANKVALAINGGAAVALLAFLGHLVANNMPSRMLVAVSPSVQSFVLGTIAAAVSSGATYAAQFCFNREGENWQRAGNITTAIAVGGWLVSIGAFAVGALGAATVIGALGQG